MGVRFTRRRVDRRPGRACWSSAALAGAVGVRVAKKRRTAATGARRRRSRSSSRRPTSPSVEAHAAVRAGCRCPGTLQPVQPGDRQGQGVRRRPPDHRARGRAGAGRADARAGRHRRPRREADRAQGALESAQGAARARREDARRRTSKLLKQKFISQNAFDSSRVELQRRAGQRQVGRGAGAARAERAARRGRRPRRCPASSPSATCSRARRSRSTRRSSPSST